MAAPATAGPTSPANHDARLGFAHWMQRVLEGREGVRQGFSPDRVHDLRVALRRCRSLAWGMRFVDPHSGWRRLNRVGRALFRALGGLRDTQVLIELARAYGRERDPVCAALLELLERTEAEQIRAAQRPLDAFRAREWSALAQTLAPRVRRLTLDGPFFEFLAVRLLDDVVAVHRRAIRLRSPLVWHRLRIAIKRFRYVVENFLPRRHARWGARLKRLQDLLGEVHDLDVLTDTLRGPGAVLDARARRRWRRLVERRRRVRIDRYRRWAIGPRSVWRVWRRELPPPDELARAAPARVAAWLEFADPEIARTRRVATVALTLFDQLAETRAGGVFGSGRARRLLEYAARCRGVGGTPGRIRPASSALTLLEQLPRLVDWPGGEIRLIALLVRSQRKRPPWAEDPRLAGLSRRGRTLLLALSGVLRLAAELDAASPSGAADLRVQRTAETFAITARGLLLDGRARARLARERALLETVLERPIVVRAGRRAGRRGDRGVSGRASPSARRRRRARPR